MDGIYMFMLIAAVIVACSGQRVDLTVNPYARGEDVVQATIDRIDSQCIFPNDKLFLRRIAFVQSYYGLDTKTFRFGYYGGIWQVDEHMFRETSTCPSRLDHVCQQIEMIFNIKWQTVQWKDLLKPLYSALAVKLYVELKHMSIVPGSIDDQALIWAVTFHQQAHYTEFSEKLASVQTALCDKKMDVVFVVDASGSIGFPNFLIMKQFLKDVTNGLLIAPDKTRVGAVRYSTDVMLEFYLNTYTTKAGVLAGIDKIYYDMQSTNTAGALTKADDEVFIPERGSREDAVKVILLVTDGESNNRTATFQAAAKAKNNGIIIFSLGIGLVNDDELNDVASTPSCTHVFTIDTFDELDSLLAEIHKSACRASRYVVTTDVHETVTVLTNETTVITETVEQKENGTTITTNVDCGIVDVYISYTTPHPGPSLHDIKDTATDQMPSLIYVDSTNDGRPLYITYVGTKLPDDIRKCNDSKFTITYTDGKTPVTEIKCFKNDVEKNCTTMDFMNSPYSNLLCKETEHLAPENPCTEGNLKADMLFHPYPGDKTKFIKCDLSGQMYITICPKPQLYNENTHGCGVTHPGQLGEDGKLPLENWIPSPCTFIAIQEHHFFFTHPDKHFFIHCDVWGNAFKVPCPQGLIWFNNIQTCSPDFLHEYDTTTIANLIHNPCTPEAIANNKLFHPYPGFPHKFIHCDMGGNYYIQECAGNMVFNPLYDTCT